MITCDEKHSCTRCPGMNVHAVIAVRGTSPDVMCVLPAVPHED